MTDIRKQLEDLSPEKRRLLEMMLAERGGQAPRPAADSGPVLDARSWEPGESAPLSPAQRRLWLLHQIDPASAAYNMPAAFDAHGVLSPDALAQGLSEIVRRHEVLRSRFPEEGEQRVDPARPVPLRRVDLTALPSDARGREAERLTAEEAARPFDLSAGPLLRATLLTRSHDRFRLLLDLHHVVSDGWSGGVLVGELTALYRAYGGGAPSPLPELPLQYRDYAAWQAERQRTAEDRQATDLDWWREQLADAPPLLELPTDAPRSADRDRRAGAFRLETSRSLAEALDDFAERRGASRFAVLLAALGVLLGRLAGQRDVVLGIPSTGRDEVELEGLVGFFVNTLPVRVRWRRGASFAELTAAVRDTLLDAQAHQDLPFETLADDLAGHDLEHTPVFQVMASLDEGGVTEGRAVDFPGVSLRPMAAPPASAKFDLTVNFSGRPREGLSLHSVYDRSLFGPDAVESWLGRFEGLLTAALADPDQPVDDLPLLTSDERMRVLETWAGQTSGYPREITLGERFRQVAAERPGATALVSGDDELTYGELAARSRRLATALAARGVGPETRVGLCLPRGFDLVTAILAVVEAGGAYVPLDPSYPSERLRYLIEDSGVELVLGDAGLLPDGVLSENGSGPEFVSVAGGLAAAPEHWADRPLPTAHPDSLLYLMYTSGSTGRPKGVAATHRGVTRLVLEADYVELGPERTLLLMAPVAFDASTFELWGALLHGARLVLMEAPKPTLEELRETVARHGVDILWATTGLFHLIVDEAPEVLAPVRHAMTGGDVGSPDHFRRALEAHPGLTVTNNYGPTENTTFTSGHRMTDPSQATAPLPIGPPIADTLVRVLDEDLEPVPPMVAGELLTGGDGLARGYWRRPALTAEKFVPDPHGEPGSRLYRTGDRSRWRPDGGLDFLGRVDTQVKIRGHRIEPGEVQVALTRLPMVSEAAVVVTGRGDGKALAAYVVAENGSASDPADALREVAAALGAALPAYLVPERWALVEALPLTAHGKFDRRALAAVPTAPLDSADAETAPEPGRTPTERAVAEVFADVLGLNEVSRDQSFFDLGGQSLLATRAISRLRDRLGVDLPLRALFETSTPATLAERVTGEEVTDGAPPLVPLSPEERARPLPLSFAQQRLWVLHRLLPESPAYNIPAAWRLTGTVAPRALATALAEVTRRHEVLRTVYRPATGPDGAPTQHVLPALPPALPTADLSGLSPRDAERELADLARREAGRLFDLTTDRPLRVALVRLPGSDSGSVENEHGLLVTVHHIAADGWSVGVFAGELSALYEAARAGAPDPLPALAVQYGDYAVWQRRRLSGERLDAELGWWRKRLAGLPPHLELPADRPRPAVRTMSGGRREHALPADLSARLDALGREAGTTPFLTLLAVYEVLLGHWSGEARFAVGTPVAGRGRREIDALVGFFVNTLALPVELSSARSFRQHLVTVRETVLAAHDHQELPFERLVEEIAPERSLAHSPVFQVSFSLVERAEQRLDLGGVELVPLRVPGDSAKFDLTVTASRRGDRWVLAGEHAADLFDPATVDRFLGHFETLARAVADEPDRPLGALSWLGESERAELVRRGAAKPAPPFTEPVYRRVLAAARRRPEAPAVVSHAGNVLTYGDLDRGSGRLAAALERLGVETEDRVAVLFDRGPGLVTSTLGVWRSGAAYLPLDPGHPEDRLRYQLTDAGVKAVVTTRELVERLPETAVPVFLVEEVVLEGEGRAPDPPMSAEQAAYVIYTSGSTGRPKGVVVSQNALCSLMAWYEDFFRVTADDRAALIVSTAFDVSVMELWPMLMEGVPLYAPSGDVRAVPADMVRYLADHLITAAFLPTPLAEATLAETWPEEAASLRYVITGGEALKRRPSDDFPTTLVNIYGPTENTVVSTGGVVATEGATLPSIGNSIGGVRSLVVDARGRLVPTGVPGELWVAGDGLARGYHNRPGLTADRFVPDPTAPEPGARAYRTGDRVRWRDADRLEFLGRLDQQVKIRGVRIELGEIEAVLLTRPAVAEASVVVQSTPTGDALAAFVVPAEGVETTPEALRRSLAEQLPDALVPGRWAILEALPLTPNGKVDRRALKAMDAALAGGGDETEEPPRGPVEELLAAAYARVLDRPVTDRRRSFFELGGHSLLAGRVLTHVQDTLGVELPLRALFEAPSVAALAEVLERGRDEAAGSTAPPLAPVDRSGPLPLSFSQERLWVIEQLRPDTAAYNIPAFWRLTGELSVRALAGSLARIVDRHEVLRTVYASGAHGDPVQVVLPAAEPRLPVADLSGLDPTDRPGALEALASREASRPFDLTAPDGGSMLRTRLVRLAAPAEEGGRGNHALLLTVHHIAADGWSVGLFAAELEALYRAAHDGRATELEPLPVQYGDYAAWQRGWLTEDALGDEVDWWRNRFADVPLHLQLPTDRPRPAHASLAGGRADRTLSADLTTTVGDFAVAAGASPFMVLLAVYEALLARWSAQPSFAVGTPVAGRERRAVEGLIGFFVNTLALPARVPARAGFGEHLRRVRETVLAATAHQSLPFERLVEELEPERSLGRSPVFQVMFSRVEASREGLRLPGLELAPVPASSATAKFDLTLTATATGDETVLGAEYASDLFDPGTVDRFLGWFEVLLTAALAEPERPLAELPLLTDGERTQVLETWAGTDSAYPREATVAHVFRRVAAERSGETALIALEDGGNAEVTYGELSARSRRLAAALAARGIGPESRVGVCLPRGFDLVTAILAVVEAGAAYVPLDPSYPAERLRYLVEDSGVELVLGDGELLPPAVLGEQAEVVSVASCSASAPDGWEERPPAPVHPDSLLYLIYTSGSTGRPKGVAATHRGVLRLLLEADYQDLGPDRTLLLMAPIAFDASICELWAALLHGSQLALMESSKPTLEEIRQTVERHGVDVLFATTGLFHLIVDEAPELLAPVRQLMTGGDVVSADPVRRALEAHPDLVFTNAYGPTENAVITTYFRTGRASEVPSPVPIGRPISDTVVRVLDAQLGLVPPGAAGELVTGGDGLARGYWGRPALTAAAFVPDPHGPAGSRLYRTGDLARWRPDGSLDFLGRVDTQVKIRGHRIEPGEVETVLGDLPAVRAAAVAVVGTSDAKALAAYVAPVASVEGTPEEQAARLATELGKSLPAYLVPERWALLDALPLTGHGKVDRRALRSLPTFSLGGVGASASSSATAAVAPRDELEAELAELWSDVLGAPVGVTDDFFAVGGHSLAGIRLLARVAERFDRSLPLSSLFEAATVAAQADLLRDRDTSDDASDELDAGLSGSPLVALRPDGAGAPSYWVHPVGGDVFSYAGLASRLDRPVWGLRAVSGLRTVEAMASRYAEEITGVRADGPLVLGGWSMGAVVAFETAALLGDRVQGLVLLDPPSAAERHALSDADEPALLRAFARDLAGLAGLAEAELREVGERLESVSVEDGMALLEDLLTRPGAAVAPDPEQLRRWFGHFRDNARALVSYSPRRRPVAADLFLAGPPPAEPFADPTRGWGELAAGGLRLHRLPGDHYTLLREPGVDDLAARIERLLSLAVTTTTSREPT